MRKDIIQMSIIELKRLHIINKAMDKLITQKSAATLLEISERQARRLISSVRKNGPTSIVHKLRGKPSSRRVPSKTVDTIVNLYKTDFAGYKPTFFAEQLAKEQNIFISGEKTRQILIAHDLWTPKKRKPKHRTKRERRHHPGELIQFDGSVHKWFPGPQGYCVLMLYIDDATNTVFARFYKYEGTIPALDSLRRYICKYGIPLALYADRHSTYSNNSNSLSLEEQLAGMQASTQFSRAVNNLAINLIPAYSPQAKGRVERSFQTFQDRLCKELHRHNIVTMKDANLFLEKFLKDHNKRFNVKPRKNIDFHRAALPAYALKKVLCIKTTRSIARDFTVQHNNQLFQLKEPTIAKKAVVEDHTNGSIVIRIKTQTMPYKNITHLLRKKNKHKEVQTIKIDPISLKEIAS